MLVFIPVTSAEFALRAGLFLQAGGRFHPPGAHLLLAGSPQGFF